MSNFDELFNSVENTEMVKNLLSDDTFSKLRSGVVEALARDSKIKLVTPYDKERPLDTGAYWYDSDENTLYVGAGDFQTIINILDFLSHNTKIVHIPAPRATIQYLIEIPTTSFITSVYVNYAPRVTFTNEIIQPTIEHLTLNKTTTKNDIEFINTVMSDFLTHESEVKYG